MDIRNAMRSDQKLKKVIAPFSVFKKLKCKSLSTLTLENLPPRDSINLPSPLQMVLLGEFSWVGTQPFFKEMFFITQNFQ
jgi:hypothetical protein